MSALDEVNKAIAKQRAWEEKLAAGKATTEELNERAPVGHEWSEDMAKYVPAGTAKAGAVEENPFITYNPMLISAGMGGIAGKVAMGSASKEITGIAAGTVLKKTGENLIKKVATKGLSNTMQIIVGITVLDYLRNAITDKQMGAEQAIGFYKEGYLTKEEFDKEIDRQNLRPEDKALYKTKGYAEKANAEHKMAMEDAGIQAAESFGYQQAPGETPESLAGRGTSESIRLQEESLKSQADKEARIAAGPYPEITGSNINLEEYARLMHDVSRQKQGISPGIQANEGVLTEELRKAVMMAPQATVEFIQSLKQKAPPQEPSAASMQTKQAGSALKTPAPAPPNPMLGYEDPFRKQSILRKKKK